MGKLLFTFMIVIVFVTFSYTSLTSELQQRASRKLTYAIEHAIHDAALFIKEDQLADGFVDFDEGKCLNVFKQGLQMNLPVDSSLNPTFSYFFEEPIKIIDMIYVDDTYLDPATESPVSFPYAFSYTYNGETFERIIFGPSIVSVIETKIYKMDKPTVKVKVEEYKFKD